RDRQTFRREPITLAARRVNVGPLDQSRGAQVVERAGEASLINAEGGGELRGEPRRRVCLLAQLQDRLVLAGVAHGGSAAGRSVCRPLCRSRGPASMNRPRFV